MRPSYIILTETGERLDSNQANEFNPNEYDFTHLLKGRYLGFYFSPEYPNESYCYVPDYDPEYGLTDTATTVGFKAYDSDGYLICEDEGGSGLWL